MTGMFKMPLRETPRELAAIDMYRARLGRAFWGTHLDEIPDRCAHKKPIRRFLRDIVRRIDLGHGFVFYGDYGTGKTSCGTIILKNVVARRGTALMIRADEITAAAIERTRFDDAQTLWERMEGVDCLLIDDIAREHVKEWAQSKLEGLVRKRIEERRSTILTTNAKISGERFLRRYRAIIEACREVCEFVPVEGVNWRTKLEQTR